MGQRTYLDIFPSSTSEKGQALTPAQRLPLLGQPEPPAKMAGLSEPMLICGIREGLTKGAILPKSISAR